MKGGKHIVSRGHMYYAQQLPDGSYAPYVDLGRCRQFGVRQVRVSVLQRLKAWARAIREWWAA